MQKRIDNLYTDLYRVFTRNQDKILPLKTLVKCIQLLPSSDDFEDQREMSEQTQAKFMTLIIREFRKNREYTKFRDQKRFADQFVKDKILSQVQNA
jgi:hypothetical protein